MTDHPCLTTEEPGKEQGKSNPTFKELDYKQHNIFRLARTSTLTTFSSGDVTPGAVPRQRAFVGEEELPFLRILRTLKLRAALCNRCSPVSRVAPGIRKREGIF